jgi:glutamyl-tRNA synthetase
MTIKVRFAPSPTGFLHVGNIRTAIINFLYAKKYNGKFFLRLDDTDTKRVKDEYRTMIFEDLNWLGIKYDECFKQSDRLERYKEAKEILIKNNRLYECFETEEELNLQRKIQNASGVAPIYNRNALKLTLEQKEQYRKKGIKPHYRFLLKDGEVSWNDKIKGKIIYDGRHFSDPVLIREEDENGYGVPTYTFCSVVDDIDYAITDIIRGEDHITNTAIQIQIFEALGAKIPEFAHLALIKASLGKISKREGGFDIKALRNEGYEAMSIINLLSQIGTSNNIAINNNFEELISKFDFNNFSKSATNYDISELSNINQKLIQNCSTSYIKSRINLNFDYKNIDFFLNIIKTNINFLHEIEEWANIFFKEYRYTNDIKDQEFLAQIIEVLPDDTSTEDAWQIWLNNIKKISNRLGKELFMPIRLALTGKHNGPELKHIMNLIERDEIIARITNK